MSIRRINRFIGLSKKILFPLLIGKHTNRLQIGRILFLGKA